MWLIYCLQFVCFGVLLLAFWWFELSELHGFMVCIVYRDLMFDRLCCLCSLCFLFCFWLRCCDSGFWWVLDCVLTWLVCLFCVFGAYVVLFDFAVIEFTIYVLMLMLFLVLLLFVCCFVLLLLVCFRFVCYVVLVVDSFGCCNCAYMIMIT